MSFTQIIRNLDLPIRTEVVESIIADLISQLEILDPADPNLLDRVDQLLDQEQGHEVLLFTLGVPAIQDYFQEVIDDHSEPTD